MLNNYYQTNLAILLDSALQETEFSTYCESTKPAAIETKIILLMLAKKYKEGYEFVNSLSVNDFKFKYKKQMYYNYFMAEDYERMNDSLRRDSCFNKIVADIERFVGTQDSVNKEAYLDLYSAKAKVSSIHQVSMEIDSLVKMYPNQSGFFNSVKASVFTIVDSASAVPAN